MRHRQGCTEQPGVCLCPEAPFNRTPGDEFSPAFKAAAGRKALTEYIKLVGPNESVEEYDRINGEGAAVKDLVGDLIQFCEHHELDWDQIRNDAEDAIIDENHEAEQQGWKWPET